MGKRILILSASIGTGHVRAAEAVKAALNAVFPEAIVAHEDFLQHTNAAFRNLYSNLYLKLAKESPELLGWFYDVNNHPWKNQQQRLSLERLNTAPLRDLLRRYAPDVVVSTHFLPAEIISWLTCRGKTSVPNVVVTTDIEINAMWLCHHYAHYFVAIEETRQHLCRLGFDPERITASGIPIDPVFSVPKRKHEMRKKYGLSEDAPVVVFTSGGHGAGRVLEIIDEILEVSQPMQLVCMCAKNQELFNTLNEKLQNLQTRHHVVPVPYTDCIDEWFCAADIIVGKSGGLTTAEALARGCALVIVDPIPGQEERNADHLLEEGVALRCNNLSILPFKLEQLLKDPARLRRMHENALRNAKPEAAETVARQVIKIATGPMTVVSSPSSHDCTHTWLPRRHIAGENNVTTTRH